MSKTITYNLDGNVIKLSKIQYFEAMSDETNAYIAEVEFNGEHIGTVKNDGQGGETYMHDGKWEKKKEINELLKGKQHKFTYGKETYTFDITFDFLCDLMMSAATFENKKVFTL